mgnify:CR=1 FL=1
MSATVGCPLTRPGGPRQRRQDLGLLVVGAGGRRDGELEHRRARVLLGERADAHDLEAVLDAAEELLLALLLPIAARAQGAAPTRPADVTDRERTNAAGAGQQARRRPAQARGRHAAVGARCEPDAGQ